MKQIQIEKCFLIEKCFFKKNVSTLCLRDFKIKAFLKEGFDEVNSNRKLL
jgi:hypothetical protein